jgi:hypothetical protein
MPVYQPKIKRIFVSSTFKDMQLERDLLRDRVLPALNQFTEQYGLTVELVDLRWGVNTADMSEEESSYKVLRTCLDEIDRSRPIFVGFLGNRYGWVPKARDVASVTQSKQYPLDDLDKSVTALEIEYGALRSVATPRCLFYFREGLVLSNETEDIRKIYEDDEALLQRQQHLKQVIRERFAQDVKSYSAHMAHHEIQLQEEFQHILLEDLRRVLSELIQEEGLQKNTEALSWQEQESQRMAAFAHARLNRFAGRRQLIDTLVNHALSRSSRRLLLLKGAPGTGKSALLCKLWQGLEYKDCTVFPFFCGISAQTSHVTGVLRHFCHQLSNLLALEDISGSFSDFLQLRRHFSTLLRRAGKNGRIVLLVDALDQLFPCEEARNLMWLPLPRPPNVRVICTMIQGEAEEKAASIRNAKISDIPAITSDDIREIVDRLALSTGKEFPTAALDELLQKKDAQGALSAGNPLYLSLLIQNLNMMNRYDHAAIDRHVQEGMAPMEAIIFFMKEQIRHAEGDPKAEYLAIVRRMEKLIGTEFVRPVLGLLAISRTGLREADVAAAMANMGRPYRSADFSWLRQLLHEHIDQGDEGQWDFAHGSLRASLTEALQAQVATGDAAMRAQGSTGDGALQAQVATTDGPMQAQGATGDGALQAQGVTSDGAMRVYVAGNNVALPHRIATYNGALLKHFMATFSHDDFAARELMHHFWTGSMESEAAALIAAPQYDARCATFFAAGLAHICQREGAPYPFVREIIEQAITQDSARAFQIADLMAVHLKKALGQAIDCQAFLSLMNATIRLLEKNRDGGLYRKRFQKEADEETLAFFRAYSHCLHAKVACLIQLDRLQEAYTEMTQSSDGLGSRLLSGWTRDIKDYAQYMEDEALGQELAVKLSQLPLFLLEFSPPGGRQSADGNDIHRLRAEVAFYWARAQYAIHRYDYYLNLESFYDRHWDRENAGSALEEAIRYVKRVIAPAERLCEADGNTENLRKLANLYFRAGDLLLGQENECEAEESIGRCLDLRSDIYHKTALDEDLVLLSEAFCSMADIMWHEGYLGDMDDYSRKALNNLQKLHQVNPVDSVRRHLANALTTRGGYFLVTGDYANAETLSARRWRHICTCVTVPRNPSRY